MRFSFVVSAGLGYQIPSLFENDLSFVEFEKALRLLREQGFTGVELNLSLDDQSILSRIRDSIRREGLQLAAVGTGLIYRVKGLSFSDPDPAVREKAIAIVKELIRFASMENSVVVIGMVRGNPSGNDAVKPLLQSLGKCDRAAFESGVRLVLEAINRYETSFLNTAADVANAIQDERLAATGILLDSFHMNIEEPSIEESIRKYHDRIAHFHIADSNRWSPGHGHLKVQDQLRSLEDLAYEGWVSAEVLPKPDNKAAVKDTANFLRAHNFLKPS
jgi:sugar phosphate isomerase/epimerase